MTQRDGYRPIAEPLAGLPRRGPVEPAVLHPFTIEAAAVEWIAAADDAEGAAAKPKRFAIRAYNGGPMQVAAFGPPVVIDLAGLTAKAPIPILANHDPQQIVGHADEIAVGDTALDLSGIVSGAGPAAAEVVASAARGFPWRASVGARPDKLEFVGEGVQTRVNGKTLTGPLYVARKATLGEVSFVAVAADGRTRAKVQATAPPPQHAKETSMDFTTWVQALGFDAAQMTDAQKAALQAKYDAELKAAAAKAPAEPGAETPQKAPAVQPPAFDLAGIALAYEKHVAACQAKAVEYAGKIEPGKLAEIQAKGQKAAIEAKSKALNEEWPSMRLEVTLLKAAAEFEVELIRAERPRGPGIHAPAGDASGQVIEAAFCRSAGLKGREKQFKAEVLEAADRYGNVTLQDLLMLQATAAGYTGRQRVSRANLREVLHFAFLRAAGFSTIDVAGILSNTANKFLLEGFQAIGQSWRQVAAVRPVSDFKTVTRYRLTDSLQYEEVPATGLIPHGELGEESYTNAAKTYAKMLVLTRQDMINDDLSAFSDIRRRLGMGSAVKLNDLFWSTWLTASNAGTFWTAARGNLVTSAALGLDGLGSAVKAFRDMPMPAAATVLDAADQARKHGNLDITPDRVLVGSTLEPTADSYFTSELIQDTTATTKRATGNIYRNRFATVVAPQLENARYTGFSATTWWMACDPAFLASAEVCFLDGVEQPTVDSTDADFDTLGIQFRGYHDFGVAMSEYRASVKLTA